MPRARTALLRRMRTLANAGGQTLFFKLEVGRLGRFLDPREVPEFEGDSAVFEYEMVGRAIRLLRQIK